MQAYGTGTLSHSQMSQLRPQLSSTGSSSGLLPYASYQTTDSYFKEPRGRSKRPKLYEKGSDILAPRSSSRSRSPKAGVSPASEDFFDECSSKHSSAADPVDELPSTSYSFSNEWQLGEPPHSAKPGYEWVWYPEPYGYWAERPEIPRASSSFSRNWPWKKISFTRKLSSSSIADKAQQNTERQISNAAKLEDGERLNSMKSLQQDPMLGDSSEFARGTAQASSTQALQQKFAKRMQFLSPRSPKIKPSVGEGEGFFKGILLGKGKKDEDRPMIAVSEFGMVSRTATVLKEVAEVLEQIARQNSDPNKLLVDPQQTQQRRGLFHSHRRRSSDSHNSLLSLTDSVRELLMGKTPLVTPQSEGRYIASDGKVYENVNLGNKDAPTYLPSEATRIRTPPLSGETSETGHGSFFFFDASPPSDESKAPSSREPSTKIPSDDPLEAKRTGSLPESGKQSPVYSSNSSNGSHDRISRLRDMWEFGTKRDSKGKKSEFELDVPEHFPNSPLCPGNPQHKSGGTGICVYHGRNLQLRRKLSSCAQSNV